MHVLHGTLQLFDVGPHLAKLLLVTTALRLLDSQEPLAPLLLSLNLVLDHSVLDFGGLERSYSFNGSSFILLIL